jgi:branched-chain amino acid transport system ATP-binding protein
MINGQLRPDRGSIALASPEGPRELVGLAPRAVWRLGVGRTFQIAAVFGSMSVIENVQMALLSHARELLAFWRPAKARHRTQALELLAAVGLADEASHPVATLAYGQVKALELAVALAHGPRLLLMDEPTAGMAPAERVALMALTRRLVTERGISVLFTEHSMDVVFSFADRVIVLARGELIAQGSVAEVRDDARVREAYFGSGRLDAARSAPASVESNRATAGDASLTPGNPVAGNPEQPA